jgi:hypothetical protein
MKYILIALVILSSCSLEKKLSRKQKRVNKLEYQIHEIKKELNLPLDTFLFSSDTFVIEKRILKRDTVKIKCDSNNRVVYVDNNEPLQGSEVITETEYVEVEKVIQKYVEKIKKEIIYKDRDYSKKEMILLAFGAVSIILLLMYSFGKFTQILIKIFKPNII